MLWDDGSLSNSPTSVRTPNDESFEVEMLDSDVRTYYQNGVDMSNQGTHHAIPATNQNMLFTPQGTFSDHGMWMCRLPLLSTDLFSPTHSFASDNGVSGSAVSSPV
jgi:hypothetical protein